MKRLSIIMAVLFCFNAFSVAVIATDTATFNGHQYQRIESSMSWKDAVDYCESLGGHLVTIASSGEQEVVMELVKEGTKAQYWLGGTDEIEEGKWVWITGEEWTYWANVITFNNYHGNEHYLQMERHHWGDETRLGVWNDINIDNYIENEEDFFSTDQVGLICEWEQVQVSSNTSYTASDWAINEIREADERGLIPEGLTTKNLRKPINRAEFAAVSVKVYEALTNTKATTIANPFVDTSDEEVLKAYHIGITNGTSQNTFSPNLILNREQAATMLTRVLKKSANPTWTLITDDQYSLVYKRGTLFSDNADISNYAWHSVYFMAANGIINGVGDNKFSPRATTSAQVAMDYASATREQALLIALRMVKFTENNDPKEMISYHTSVSINDYIPPNFDWTAGANGDETFIDGKWVSPDGQSVLYIDHSSGPDTFTLWFYTCKDGFEAGALYEIAFADVLSEGKAESSEAGMVFIGVQNGILLETDWEDGLYTTYGNPDGIYYLEKSR
ncbi:MAG: S-layer homology domain-containing protein [Vallitaleaceae bacterium]|nr:S-layer homology domain-containing protein [Vallitaleaceae bacterium]